MMTNSYIQKIKQSIEPLRQEIINHPVYNQINSVDDLKIFMRFHIYAVWDFMSLLKTLQNQLTCTAVPWFPQGSADTRYLINEIVAGEESDLDLDGNRKSHFELYLNAMDQCGANITEIANFIQSLKGEFNLELAYTRANTPQEARNFVSNTFRVIDSRKAYLQSAVFTFGREDLIPGMFVSLVQDLNHKFPQSISIFKYYLERHIEVDGDHHSQLALQMTANLCGEQEVHWKEAEEACIASLKSRMELWNGAHRAIIKNKSARLIETPSR
jgi:hypothetical protein